MKIANLLCIVGAVAVPKSLAWIVGGLVFQVVSFQLRN